MAQRETFDECTHRIGKDFNLTESDFSERHQSLRLGIKDTVEEAYPKGDSTSYQEDTTGNEAHDLLSWQHSVTCIAYRVAIALLVKHAPADVVENLLNEHPPL